MKKLLLMATMLLSFGAVKAQISDVQQKGSYLYVYGENNKQLSYMIIGSSDKFKSAGGNSFNIKKGSYIYTYDKNCEQLSYRIE